MSFKKRTKTGITLVNIVKNHFWDKNLHSLYHVETGYEKNIPDNIRNILRPIRNLTARHIKFTPDYMVVDKSNPDNVYYLEYKCTQTIGRSVDSGQMELDAYDNYVALQSIGVRVAVLNYVAYHGRLLLCDFIENINVTYRSEGKTKTKTGSGTPFVNYDLNGMRTLLDFLVDEHGVNRDAIERDFNNACTELKSSIPEKHKSR